MGKKKSIKTLNNPVIGICIIWCLSLYILFNFVDVISWSNLKIVFSDLRIENGIFIALLPLIALILNGIFGHNLKAILIYWRIKDQLPGSRVYTKYIYNDNRIDEKELEKKMGKLPQNPSEQNSTWYKQYKQRENKTPIFNSHRAYILTRDLGVISFISVCLIILFMIFFRIKNKQNIYLVLIYMIQYVLFCISAQNYAKRFVCNVIADYLCEIQ